MDWRKRGTLFAASMAVAVGVAAPGAASAATVTVTGDDGNPVALGGPINIRNMSPQVALTPASGEHYGFTVTGPNGGQVSSPATCVAAGDAPRTVDYVGN